jgi:four helix bundle suffix protein
MLPKYKYLLTYRYAEIIQDLTPEFCRLYILSDLSNLSHLGGRRTVEQMNAASRSNKQNIVEGVSEVASLKSQIKLLGVAGASTEELTSDFEDFLRQRNLPIWERNDPRIQLYRNLGIEATSTYPPKLPKLLKELRKGPTEAANLMLTLCHQLSYLLSRQIQATEDKFIREGGYSENLFKKRLKELKSLR